MTIVYVVLGFNLERRLTVVNNYIFSVNLICTHVYSLYLDNSFPSSSVTDLVKNVNINVPTCFLSYIEVSYQLSVLCT